MAASAAMAIMAASSVASATAQAKAQKSEANFKRQQGEQNARLADMQAEDAEKRGKKEAKNHLRKVKGITGAQRAALAASGVDIGSGSALELQEDTAALGEYDAAVIRNNASREAFGFRTTATNYRNQAKFDYMTGKYAARNTLLTGGMQAASYGLQGVAEYRKNKITTADDTPKSPGTQAGGTLNKHWSKA